MHSPVTKCLETQREKVNKSVYTAQPPENERIFTIERDIVSLSEYLSALNAELTLKKSEYKYFDTD